MIYDVCFGTRRLAFYLSFFVGVAALVLIWLLYPKGFDYPGAIADNVTYFQVRRWGVSMSTDV